MDVRSHGMNMGRQNDYATKADWERHRNRISLLYEGKELAEVKRIMETEHGFKATLVRYFVYRSLIAFRLFSSELRCIRHALQSGV